MKKVAICTNGNLQILPKEDSDFIKFKVDDLGEIVKVNAFFELIRIPEFPEFGKISKDLETKIKKYDVYFKVLEEKYRNVLQTTNISLEGLEGEINIEKIKNSGVEEEDDQKKVLTTLTELNKQLNSNMLDPFSPTTNTIDVKTKTEIKTKLNELDIKNDNEVVFEIRGKKLEFLNDFENLENLKITENYIEPEIFKISTFTDPKEPFYKAFTDKLNNIINENMENLQNEIKIVKEKIAEAEKEKQEIDTKISIIKNFNAKDKFRKNEKNHKFIFEGNYKQFKNMRVFDKNTNVVQENEEEPMKEKIEDIDIINDNNQNFFKLTDLLKKKLENLKSLSEKKQKLPSLEFFYPILEINLYTNVLFNLLCGNIKPEIVQENSAINKEGSLNLFDDENDLVKKVILI